MDHIYNLLDISRKNERHHLLICFEIKCKLLSSYQLVRLSISRDYIVGEHISYNCLLGNFIIKIFSYAGGKHITKRKIKGHNNLIFD